jgi:hypothetical protein
MHTWPRLLGTHHLKLVVEVTEAEAEGAAVEGAAVTKIKTRIRIRRGKSNGQHLHFPRDGWVIVPYVPH